MAKKENVVEIDGLYYQLFPEKGTARISDNRDNTRLSEGGTKVNLKIKSPITYNGKEYKVVGIAGSAFQWCKNIKSVELPESVWRMLDDAFCACTSLETLILHNDIYVGYTNPESVFCNCPLKDIYLYYPLVESDGLRRWLSDFICRDKEDRAINHIPVDFENLTLHVYKDTDDTSLKEWKSYLEELEEIKIVCDL